MLSRMLIKKYTYTIIGFKKILKNSFNKVQFKAIVLIEIYVFLILSLDRSRHNRRSGDFCRDSFSFQLLLLLLLLLLDYPYDYYVLLRDYRALIYEPFHRCRQQWRRRGRRRQQRRRQRRRRQRRPRLPPKAHQDFSVDAAFSQRKQKFSSKSYQNSRYHAFSVCKTNFP